MKNPFKNRPPGILFRLVIALERIAMDTSALNSGIAKFAADFSKFATDLSAFLSGLQTDTPQQVADVAAAVTALNNFDAQVQTLDASVNPPAPPPPPPPPVG